MKEFKFKRSLVEPFRPINVTDDLGLRRSIFPLFNHRNDGISGLGTAFLADGQINLITALHNLGLDTLDFSSEEVSDSVMDLTRFFRERQIVTFFGIKGIVFGTMRAPAGRIARVSGCLAPVIAADDPLLQLRGKGRVEGQADIAFLQTEPEVDASDIADSLRVSGNGPIVNDWVCAVGYPNIDIVNHVRSHDIVATIREETMQLAFGKVSAVHESGRGRFNQMPVFEVEANWASGMSGGPVLNENGEVVGVVSRSIEPLPGETATVGTATMLVRL